MRVLGILFAGLLLAQPLRADVLVEIQGAVERPGTYFVPDNSTLLEVARLAGGLSAKADRRKFVLQKRLESSRDGSKVVVTIPFINGGDEKPVIASSGGSARSPLLAELKTSTRLNPSDLQGEWPISGIKGWDTRKFPLAVWVEPLGDSDLSDRYAPSLAAALDRWNLAWQELGRNKPAFRFVAQAEKADVLVRWRRLRKDLVGESTLGHAVPLSDQQVFQIPNDTTNQQYIWHKLKRAYVELDLITNAGKYYNPTAMYLITTHELGHVLGLEHTRDRFDLMSPSIAVPIDQDREADAEAAMQRVHLIETLAALRNTYNILDAVARQDRP